MAHWQDVFASCHRVRDTSCEGRSVRLSTCQCQIVPACGARVHCVSGGLAPAHLHVRYGAPGPRDQVTTSLVSIVVTLARDAGSDAGQVEVGMRRPAVCDGVGTGTCLAHLYYRTVLYMYLGALRTASWEYRA